MTQPITIVGAGMAGLLAGNVLRRSPVQIVERQSALPNNHHAVLRFRTEKVSTATHIPFRAVKVFKACDIADPIRAALLYSEKVTGRYEVRSLIDLSTCERYIAPPDFIEQMAAGLNIAYGVDGIGYLQPDRREEFGPVISTLPMPLLMDALEYDGPRPEFVSREGWTASCVVADCDIYATRYFADGIPDYYRASITGNRLVVEFVGEAPGADADLFGHSFLRHAAATFGISASALGEAESQASRYAKLGALSPEDRRKALDFMFWASSKLNVFSLGRFATWRSGLLLDDVVDDVLKIERWINGSTYDQMRSV